MQRAASNAASPALISLRQGAALHAAAARSRAGLGPSCKSHVPCCIGQHRAALEACPGTTSPVPCRAVFHARCPSCAGEGHGQDAEQESPPLSVHDLPLQRRAADRTRAGLRRAESLELQARREHETLLLEQRPLGRNALIGAGGPMQLRPPSTLPCDAMNDCAPYALCRTSGCSRCAWAGAEGSCRSISRCACQF